MKLVAEPIFVPNDADWQTIEDAKSRAKWHEVKSREELMAETNLDGKCGSCKHFCVSKTRDSMGRCELKIQDIRDYRKRCNPACQSYERKG